jgi:spermidine synthase
MLKRGLLAILAVGTAAVAPAEETVLYRHQSRYNRIVVTENDRGLRVLWFDDGRVRQSAARLDDPDYLEFRYLRVMPVGLAFVEAPLRMLVVGLGGGTLPVFLHRHWPQALVEAVDIDPDVVDAARRFFGFREDAGLRAYVSDGRRFVAARPDRYDLVFLDAYGADSIPYHLTTREFLTAVRASLRSGGAVVANLWSRDSNRLYDSMVRTYHDVFEEVVVFDVEQAGNKIVVALPRRRPVDRSAIAGRARQIALDHRFRFDLGQSALRGFRRPDEELRRGTVLEDR